MRQTIGLRIRNHSAWKHKLPRSVRCENHHAVLKPPLPLNRIPPAPRALHCAIDRRSRDLIPIPLLVKLHEQARRVVLNLSAVIEHRRHQSRKEIGKPIDSCSKVIDFPNLTRPFGISLTEACATGTNDFLG